MQCLVLCLLFYPKTMQNILWILNAIPYRGKFSENHKRRGKPLRYNLPSLRDLPITKFHRTPTFLSSPSIWRHRLQAFAAVAACAVFDVGQLLHARASCPTRVQRMKHASTTRCTHRETWLRPTLPRLVRCRTLAWNHPECLVARICRSPFRQGYTLPICRPRAFSARPLSTRR